MKLKLMDQSSVLSLSSAKIPRRFRAESMASGQRMRRGRQRRRFLRPPVCHAICTGLQEVSAPGKLPILWSIANSLMV
jgi:hypothetical protein